MFSVIITRIEDKHFSPGVLVPEKEVLDWDEVHDINGEWRLGHYQEPREKDLIEVETKSGKIKYIALETYQNLGGE